MSHSGLWQRLTHGVQRLFHRPDWPALVGANADRIMDIAVTDRFHAKQGRSTGRWVLESKRGRLAVFLKRHCRLPWWQRLLATLRPDRGWSPALSEWRHLHWAKQNGLRVPEPVAVGEYVGPWFRLQSYLAVEELTGMIPLNEAVLLARCRLSRQAFQNWKGALTHELARLARILHEHRRYHKDFYISHFFVSHADVERDASARTAFFGRVYLIDFHRLASHPLTWRRWQIKDLAQLLFSSFIPGINTRDRLRFLLLYAREANFGWEKRRLARVVSWKASRYLRHNASRSAA